MSVELNQQITAHIDGYTSSFAPMGNGYTHNGCQSTNCWQHTTLYPTAHLPLKRSRVGPGGALDRRPDAAGSGVKGPIGDTLSFGLNIYIYTCCKSRGVNPAVRAEFWCPGWIPNLALILSWPPNHPQLPIGSFIPPLPCNYSLGCDINENVFSFNFPGNRSIKYNYAIIYLNGDSHSIHSISMAAHAVRTVITATALALSVCVTDFRASVHFASSG
jgi:hypothetical protein